MGMWRAIISARDPISALGSLGLRTGTLHLSSFSGTSTALEYKEYGDPVKVITQKEVKIPELNRGEVRTRETHVQYLKI